MHSKIFHLCPKKIKIIEANILLMTKENKITHNYKYFNKTNKNIYIKKFWIWPAVPMFTTCGSRRTISDTTSRSTSFRDIRLAGATLSWGDDYKLDRRCRQVEMEMERKWWRDYNVPGQTILHVICGGRTPANPPPLPFSLQDLFWTVLPRPVWRPDVALAQTDKCRATVWRQWEPEGLDLWSHCDASYLTLLQKKIHRVITAVQNYSPCTRIYTS